MEGTSNCSLIASFAGLSDPRQSAKVLYPLPEIMLLLLCATLAGADDFVEIAVWGERNLGFLRRLLPFQHGIPSHDTLGEVIAMLDPAVFRGCFTGWVAGLRKPMPEAVGPVPGRAHRPRPQPTPSRRGGAPALPERGPRAPGRGTPRRVPHGWRPGRSVYGFG